VDTSGNVRSVNAQLPPKKRFQGVLADAETVPSVRPSSFPNEEFLDEKTQRHIKFLRQQLELRPLLSSRMAVNLLNIARSQLRVTIPYVGYTFSGGPFKDIIVKYGVDPRTNPRYRIYQALTIHLPDRSRDKMYGQASIGQGGGDKSKRHIFDGKHFYTDGRSWQICDVTDPTLHRLMEDANPSDRYDVGAVRNMPSSFPVTNSQDSPTRSDGIAMALGPFFAPSSSTRSTA
jgi:general transcription factor 3C polypeptide 5 (transcription factor C subunit 1)